MLLMSIVCRTKPADAFVTADAFHQLAGEGSGHFDLGEMAFDATFDDEYAEQEVCMICHEHSKIRDEVEGAFRCRMND